MYLYRTLATPAFTSSSGWLLTCQRGTTAHPVRVLFLESALTRASCRAICSVPSGVLREDVGERRYDRVLVRCRDRVGVQSPEHAKVAELDAALRVVCTSLAHWSPLVTAGDACHVVCCRRYHPCIAPYQLRCPYGSSRIVHCRVWQMPMCYHPAIEFQLDALPYPEVTPFNALFPGMITSKPRRAVVANALTAGGITINVCATARQG